MSLAPDRLLRLPEVLGLIGISRPVLYRKMKRPLSDSGFPRQIKLGRASAWSEREVLAWVEARKAERKAD
jgi:prophage regulatory protein